MKIDKLIRQFGEKGNEYSPIEMGDKINEIIDAICGVQPEKQSEKKPEIKVVNKGVIKKDKKGGYVARSSATADMVYYIVGKNRHWVRNPETLKKLGFGFHDVVNISNEEMTKYESIDPLDLTEKKPLEVVKPKDATFDKYNF